MNLDQFTTQSIFGPPQHKEFGAFLERDRNRTTTRLTRKVSATEIAKLLKNQLLTPYSKFIQPENGVGGQISFAEFMATRPDGGEVFLSDRTGKPLGWADLFNAMKADPSTLLLNELASMNDDFRGLVGPLITDAFVKGYSETPTGSPPLWSQMCFATGVAANFDAIRKTWLKFQGEPTPTAEGEMFPEATIRSGNEKIELQKRGLTLRLTSEFIRENPLTIIESWLTEMGRVYQAIENDRCVETLLNGDVATGANAAPVVGVSDIAVGIDFADFSRCWNRASMIGENWDTFVAGEMMSQKISSLDEFKIRENGRPMVQIEGKPEPSNMKRFVSSKIPDHQVLLVDRSHALRQRVFIPLRIDRSFKPENWTEGVTIGYVTGFERVADKACLVIDESLDFATHGFPDWFTIGGSRP